MEIGNKASTLWQEAPGSEGTDRYPFELFLEGLPIHCIWNSMHYNIETKWYNLHQYVTKRTTLYNFHNNICAYCFYRIDAYCINMITILYAMLLLGCWSILFDFGYNILQSSIQSCFNVVTWYCQKTLYNMVHKLFAFGMFCTIMMVMMSSWNPIVINLN